jgi:FkbM family methyltransferase
LGRRVQTDLQAVRRGVALIGLIRRLGKKALRAAGIDIRFIPKLGFDAFVDMRKLAGTQTPVVFDVGANRGQSIERFRKTFARPAIHSFEPGREAFAELRRLHGDTPGVVLNNVALGPRAESRLFLDNDHDDMSSFLEPSVTAWGEIRDRYPVEMITLDDYCRTHGIERIDILKIDTQGFDLQVLAGAEQMLRAPAIRMVFTEVIFSEMYKGLPRFDETYAFFADRGFALVSLYDFYYQNDRASWTDALFIR